MVFGCQVSQGVQLFSFSMINLAFDSSKLLKRFPPCRFCCARQVNKRLAERLWRSQGLHEARSAIKKQHLRRVWKSLPSCAFYSDIRTFIHGAKVTAKNTLAASLTLPCGCIHHGSEQDLHQPYIRCGDTGEATVRRPIRYGCIHQGDPLALGLAGQTGLFPFFPGRKELGGILLLGHSNPQ